NEKKFPEVASFVKTLNVEAKQLTAEVKKLRDTRGKELDAEVKKTKAPAAQEALKQFQQQVAVLEKLSKMLPEIVQRLLHAEIQHLPPTKETVATVTSPLGTQSSRTLRLLGESKPLAVSPDHD